MWRCPTCGEQIEDQFDSCWKCTGPDSDAGGAALRTNPGSAFFRYWRRGWVILALTLLVELCFKSAGYMLHWAASCGMRWDRANQGTLLVLAVLALAVLLVPAGAYLLFVIIFGEEAWPFGKKGGQPSQEEIALALMDEAEALEARGKNKEALLAYQEVVDEHPQTAVALRARKKLSALRAGDPSAPPQDPGGS